jgi:hypothetical protein
MKFAVYHLNSGQIISTAQCQTIEQLDSQIDPALHGALEIDNDVFGRSHHVVQGAVVLLPQAPSATHVFDHEGQVWVDPNSSLDPWQAVRFQRDRLLSNCDWTQLPDVPMATKEVWTIYRQALRDITNQADPLQLGWPVSP